MANQPPEKTFRIGYVSASVFKRTVGGQGSPKRTLRSVVLQKSYKDGNGQRQYTNSFDLAEMPLAERVLALARGYVETCEAETTG